MSFLSFLATLPDWNSFSNSAPNLSGLSNLPHLETTTIIVMVLILIVMIPVTICLGSIPMWTGSLLVVPRGRSSSQAVTTQVYYIFWGLFLGIGGIFLKWIAGKFLGPGGDLFASLAIFILQITMWIRVPSRVYHITIPRTLGLLLTTFVVMFSFTLLAFLGSAAELGTARAMAPLQASASRIRDVQASGLSLVPIPSLSTPAPPDYTGEIDSLLNTALHPAGAGPSLSEREEMVRTLQQKLQTQRNNLPAGDTRAAMVYQNQLNRYLLLLEQVKNERKLHPLRADAPAVSSTPAPL